MPLVQKVLAYEIYDALTGLSDAAKDGLLPIEVAQLQAANKIATAIDTYIRSATIVIPPGQSVTTAGSPTAQTGTTTSPSAPATIT